MTSYVPTKAMHVLKQESPCINHTYLLYHNITNRAYVDSNRMGSLYFPLPFPVQSKCSCSLFTDPGMPQSPCFFPHRYFEVYASHGFSLSFGHILFLFTIWLLLFLFLFYFSQRSFSGEWIETSDNTTN